MHNLSHNNYFLSWYSARTEVWTSQRTFFESRQEKEIVLFSKVPRPALGSTQNFVQYIPGHFPRDKKLPTYSLQCRV